MSKPRHNIKRVENIVQTCEDPYEERFAALEARIKGLELDVGRLQVKGLAPTALAQTVNRMTEDRT